MCRRKYTSNIDITFGSIQKVSHRAVFWSHVKVGIINIAEINFKLSYIIYLYNEIMQIDINAKTSLA